MDEFQYNYSVIEKPHVQNDTVTLNKRFAQVGLEDFLARLSGSAGRFLLLYAQRYVVTCGRACFDSHNDYPGVMRPDG